MSRTALPHVYSGKVRELYAVEHDALLMVASDRISVFDVVLPDEIPDKGRVLTALSSFWFDHTRDIVGNHVISCDPTDFPPMSGDVAGRAGQAVAAVRTLDRQQHAGRDERLEHLEEEALGDATRLGDVVRSHRLVLLLLGGHVGDGVQGVAGCAGQFHGYVRAAWRRGHRSLVRGYC